MPLPPPRHPRHSSDSNPEPEPGPRRGLAPQYSQAYQEPEPAEEAVEAETYEDSPQDAGERRRQLREQTLRGMRKGNLAMQMPAPSAGFTPRMPDARMAWWKYALIFPLVLGVVALLVFTLMVDPSEIQNRDTAKQSAICSFARISVPPKEATGVEFRDPSETPNRKYGMRFSAQSSVIDDWIKKCQGLQGVEPTKVGMVETYAILAEENQPGLRNATVTVNRFEKTVEVVVDGFKSAPQESNISYAERRIAEMKALRAKQDAANGVIPKKRPDAAGGLPVETPTASVPLDPEEEARKARELEVLRILQSGGSYNSIPKSKASDIPGGAPAASPTTGMENKTPVRPRIVGDLPTPDSSKLPLPQ